MSAVQKTRETLVELEAIRKDLDLPVDALRTIFDVWAHHKSEIDSEAHMRMFHANMPSMMEGQAGPLDALVRPFLRTVPVQNVADEGIIAEQLRALGIKPR